MKLSQRVRGLQPSATLAITAKAKQMRAEGIDVIGFGAGEPDFDTPVHVVAAARAALDRGDTRYTPVGGVPELRAAVCHRMSEDYGLTYSPGEVTVSVGAKHTLFNLFMALLDEGDEVVIPAPYWVSYPEQVRLAGGTVVIVPTREEDGFRLTPEALEASLGPRTRALVLNSPSNPTGALYRRAHLSALAEVIGDRDLTVVSDDIYQRLVYGGARFTGILEAAPSLRDRTVIVNGVSKAYAMTGWRIGYAAGPTALISAMEKIQSQSTSNPTSFAQQGAVAALTGPQGCVETMQRAFEQRRRQMVDGLCALDGVRCREPEGAFYVFPNVTGLFGRKADGVEINDAMGLTRYLLDEARVAVIPGTPFGAEGYLRLSYAAAPKTLTEGLDRMGRALARLTGGGGSQ